MATACRVCFGGRDLPCGQPILNRQPSFFRSIAVHQNTLYGLLNLDRRIYTKSLEDSLEDVGHAWEVSSAPGKPWCISIAIHENMIYCVGDNHKVYCQNLSNLSVSSSWNLLNEKGGAESIAVANDSVYVSGHDGRVYCQNLHTIARYTPWQLVVNRGKVWCLAVTGACLFGIGSDSHLYRHAHDHESRWEAAAHRGRMKWKSIAIDSGRFFGVADDGHDLYHQHLDQWPFDDGIVELHLHMEDGTPMAICEQRLQRSLQADNEQLFVDIPRWSEPACASLRMVCISDTHGRHRNIHLPEGDILIHAGDLTDNGSEEELQAIAVWFHELQVQGLFQHVLCVAGNHDSILEATGTGEDDLRLQLQNSATYLEDSGFLHRSLSFYGTPWTPFYQHQRSAFASAPGEVIFKHWQKIPDEIDVLIVHGPPLGRGDFCRSGYHAGCPELLHEIQCRVRPRLVVHGHIHEGFARNSFDGHTLFINAALLQKRNWELNAPIVVDVPLDRTEPARIVDLHPPCT